MVIETLSKSILPIAFEMVYHYNALLASSEFLHFQLAPVLGRKHYETVPITV